MSFAFPAVGSNPWYLAAEGASVGSVLEKLRASGALVRLLRGKRMRSLDQMFGEFAAAFQFPPYFGDNWHALDECLGELDWLDVSGGVAIVLEQAEMVLEADRAELDRLVKGIGYAAVEWAATTELGPGSARPPMPFLVVTHMSGEHRSRGLKTWRAAGVKFDEFLPE